MKLEEIKDKKVLIVGFGKEGISVQTLLKNRIPDIDIDIADDTVNPLGFKMQYKFDIAIRSPSVRPDRLSIPHTTATNIFFSNTKCITIGITGTKGKSTTSSLIYSIIKEQGWRVHLAGNIGRPLTEILNIEKPGDFCVCELSSYQLEDIQKSPHISVFLNFFPEHMDHHGSVAEYWIAKSRIAAYVQKNDFFVFNNKYKKISELAQRLACVTVPLIPKLPFPDASIPLVGKHNRDNVRAAVAVGSILKIPDRVMERAIRSFKALAHRLENIGTYKEITFYDDAISTTPQSTICAIEALNKVDTIFLGGLDRGYNFRNLSKIIKQRDIGNVILFPNSGPMIRKNLESVGYMGNIYETDNMDLAVAYSYDHTKPHHIALLSCASPSYSLWKNFEYKGLEFQRAVKNIGNMPT